MTQPRLKLLLISRCPPYPLHLGDRLIPYHLTERLAARGHEIDLLAFYDRPTDPDEIGHYRALFQHIELIPEPKRGTLTYLARLRRMFPRRADEAWSPAMWQAIESRLAVGRYDVIQFFGGVQVYEYRALAQGTPNLIVPYESYSLFLARRMAQTRGFSARLMTALQTFAARRYERAMFRGFGRVVVLTDVDAAALTQLAPGLPVRVIPNGIDLARFPPAEPATAPILLFVGNYEYPPNLDAALFLARQIFPLVRATLPEARLMLVGSAPPPELQALQDDQITVTGRVPDVQPYLAQAALFISPLRFGAGIKNKVLEAMAMGKALVATPLSADGIGLRAGEHALFGESAEALAGAALQLLRAPDLRQRMGAANRALIASRFTWDRVADAYEALYAEIVGTTSGA